MPSIFVFSFFFAKKDKESFVPFFKKNKDFYHFNSQYKDFF
jgi:hypothetical protein